MHIYIKLIRYTLVALVLIYLPLPATAAAGQIPLKEEISSYEIDQDTQEQTEPTEPTDDTIPQTGNGSLAPIFLTLALISLSFATLTGANE